MSYNIIHLDEAALKGELKNLVRNSVEKRQYSTITEHMPPNHQKLVFCLKQFICGHLCTVPVLQDDFIIHHETRAGKASDEGICVYFFHGFRLFQCQSFQQPTLLLGHQFPDLIFVPRQLEMAIF